ncbi:unnamed protein product [Caretta caretta]
MGCAGESGLHLPEGTARETGGSLVAGRARNYKSHVTLCLKEPHLHSATSAKGGSGLAASGVVISHQGGRRGGWVGRPIGAGITARGATRAPGWPRLRRRLPLQVSRADGGNGSRSLERPPRPNPDARARGTRTGRRPEHNMYIRNAKSML